ncbi:MAG: VWA domain-containing protein [Candidatus Geothermarchaeales archaeon]
MSEPSFSRGVVFPFAALVDQELLKTGLILNAVNPAIGGLLIRGAKGSGKSTAVRALAELLPELEVSVECSFRCDPTNLDIQCSTCRKKLSDDEELRTRMERMHMVDLPLGATEDRVVGSLDMEKVLRQGVRALQPGVLAQANRNILYVDEINLLPDHLVDSILDAAASGWNVIEREGISVRHPSRFILVGTMNPEEGELRPQLLDRLPLSVTLENITDEGLRVKIAKRNIAFGEDAKAFRKRFEDQQEEFRGRILSAREILNEVRVSEEVFWTVAKICSALAVDGHRPDIVIIQTAKTVAAWNQRRLVTSEDVAVATKLALGHRTRRGGLERPASPELLEEALKESAKWVQKNVDITEQVEQDSPEVTYSEAEKAKESKNPEKGKPSKKGTPRFSTSHRLLPELRKKEGKLGSGSKDLRVRLMETVKGTAKAASASLRRLTGRLESTGAEGRRRVSPRVEYWWSVTPTADGAPVVLGRDAPTVYSEGKGGFLRGRRFLTTSSDVRGREVGSRPYSSGELDLALLPSIRTHIASGRWAGSLPLELDPQDLREKRRVYRAPLTIIAVLDMSRSMTPLIGAVHAALTSIHRASYHYRDRLGIITLVAGTAKTFLHPTNNSNVVSRTINNLHWGGTTALAQGLVEAARLASLQRRKTPSSPPLLVLFTDGIATEPLHWDSSGDPLEDVLFAGRLLARQRIPVIVFNPLHTEIEEGSVLSPTGLLQWLAQATGGRYHGYTTGFFTTTMKKDKVIADFQEALRELSPDLYN